MLLHDTITAKKYAVAFLNLYSNRITPALLENISAAALFLKKNNTFRIALQIPTIAAHEKKRALTAFAKAFHLNAAIIKLLDVLLLHGRVNSIHKVLRRIVSEYHERVHIMACMIRSSQRLSEEEQKIVSEYLATLTSAQLVSSFVVDPSLIMGIRAESATALWERSIRKKLRLLSTTLIGREIV